MENKLVKRRNNLYVQHVLRWRNIAPRCWAYVINVGPTEWPTKILRWPNVIILSGKRSSYRNSVENFLQSTFNSNKSYVYVTSLVRAVL